jgi:Glycosyl transferases group 1
MSQRLWDEIVSVRPDAVLSYCFASDVETQLVRDTVAAGIPWINFFCDGVYAFDRVAPIARETSLNWFPESAAEPHYRALGRPVLCRPYALNPAALPEPVGGEAVHPLGFVGAAYGTRALQVAALAALGCRVTVRGEGWLPRAGRSAGHAGVRRTKRMALPTRLRRLGDRLLVRALSPWIAPGEPLTDTDLTRFVSECHVVLGLNEAPAARRADRSYLKMRDVEFPGYGACYLTQHNSDVARAFDVGREVLTFRSLVEAAALARDHAARPARAEAIGRAGRLRVLREHTWATRIDEIVRAL